MRSTERTATCRNPVPANSPLGCGVRADAFSLASAANRAKSTDAGLSAWRALPRDVRIARRPRQELGILLPSHDIALIETTSTIFFADGAVLSGAGDTRRVRITPCSAGRVSSGRHLLEGVC